MRKAKTSSGNKKNMPLVFESIGSFGKNDEYQVCLDSMSPGDLCIVMAGTNEVIGNVTRTGTGKNMVWGSFYEGKAIQYLGQYKDQIEAAKKIADKHYQSSKAR